MRVRHCAAAALPIVAILVAWFLWPSPDPTRVRFDRIRPGMTRANVEEIMGETGERHFLAARDDGYWMWFHGKAGNGNVFIAWDTECVIETLWAVPDHDPPLLIHLWNRLAAALGP